MKKLFIILTFAAGLAGCSSEGGSGGGVSSHEAQTPPGEIADTPAPNPESPQPKTEITECTDMRTSFADKEIVEEVCRLVNEERDDAGALPLKMDSALSRVAQAHARDMYERSFFSHTNLEGQSPFDRMHEAGISYRTAGENIARGQKSPEAVMIAWMNSSGHRANILKSGYGKIGVGFYKNYWVQVFTN